MQLPHPTMLQLLANHKGSSSSLQSFHIPSPWTACMAAVSGMGPHMHSQRLSGSCPNTFALPLTPHHSIGTLYTRAQVCVTGKPTVAEHMPRMFDIPRLHQITALQQSSKCLHTCSGHAALQLTRMRDQSKHVSLSRLRYATHRFLPAANTQSLALAFITAPTHHFHAQPSPK